MAHTVNPFELIEEISLESVVISKSCLLLEIKKITLSVIIDQVWICRRLKAIINFHQSLLSSKDAQGITLEFAKQAHTDSKEILESIKRLSEKEKSLGKVLQFFLTDLTGIISDLEEIVSDYSIILDPEVHSLFEELEEVVNTN